MNLTDRIYVGVHVALTVLVCARYDVVTHGWRYIVWNAVAVAAIVIVARKRDEAAGWEFAHDWLPLLFFTTVFEEVSFLALTIRGTWQNEYLVAVESAIFPAGPSVWLHQHLAAWSSELLEFGYFTFYPLYPAVAGVLWAWRTRPQFAGAFRKMTDSLSVGYLACYGSYLLFPTRSPSHNAGLTALRPGDSGGPFHVLVRLIQGRAGVHGNAFPSAHIMLAFVVLVFTFRYLPRVAPVLLFCVLLMCVGAIYDGYHYAIDVVAGAALGLVVALPFVSAPRAAALD
jgi:membrane-associated phospholipid phosphatase